jgi:hypothetical protein
MINIKKGMKRIIRLTESDLTRIIRRVINEETKDECPDTICYQYDYDNDTCVHVKDMKSKKLIDEWYDEKSNSEKHNWFFDLIYDDRDVRDYYITLKKDKSGGWGKKNDIFFFRRLAVEYCKGDNSDSGEKTQNGINTLLKYVNSNMCGKSGEDCPPV